LNLYRYAPVAATVYALKREALGAADNAAADALKREAAAAAAKAAAVVGSAAAKSAAAAYAVNQGAPVPTVGMHTCQRIVMHRVR
jgi:hypothetical protein